MFILILVALHSDHATNHFPMSFIASVTRVAPLDPMNRSHQPHMFLRPFATAPSDVDDRMQAAKDKRLGLNGPKTSFKRPLPDLYTGAYYGDLWGPMLPWWSSNDFVRRPGTWCVFCWPFHHVSHRCVVWFWDVLGLVSRWYWAHVSSCLLDFAFLHPKVIKHRSISDKNKCW